MWDRTKKPFANSFGVCPLFLDGVEVRRIDRQEVKEVSGVDDGRSNVCAFMECGVIHHNDACRRPLRQQILNDPLIENICVDVGFEQTSSQKNLADQSADNVCSTFRMPVAWAKTPLAGRGIAMLARHVMSKTAFVDIDDRASLRLINLNSLTKGMPCGGVRFGMLKCFFSR